MASTRKTPLTLQHLIDLDDGGVVDTDIDVLAWGGGTSAFLGLPGLEGQRIGFDLVPLLRAAAASTDRKDVEKVLAKSADALQKIELEHGL